MPVNGRQARPTYFGEPPVRPRICPFATSERDRQAASTSVCLIPKGSSVNPSTILSRSPAANVPKSTPTAPDSAPLTEPTRVFSGDFRDFSSPASSTRETKQVAYFALFSQRSSWLAKAWRCRGPKFAGPPMIRPSPRSPSKRLRAASRWPTFSSVYSSPRGSRA